MRYQPPKFERLAEMSTIDVGRLTEEEARGILEGLRWPDGPVCPHCGEKAVTRLTESEAFRDGLIQCNACRGQFTVTVGTVMHRSHITLRQWVQAFHSMCSHKKGVSALQLQRNLGLGSYKSAWHLAHRVRLAMRQEPLAGALKGTVEADETYIGPRRREGMPKGSGGAPKKRGRGAPRKAIVVALVERPKGKEAGRVRARVVENVKAATLKAAIRENVEQAARIVTDELGSYHGLGREFAGGHETVNHSRGEYVRGDVHVNGGESFFALLKRGIHGTFHHVSKTHLHRYCDEFSFRWDYRKASDGQRAEEAIRGAEGKRLEYKVRA